jgi:c(7)-type cytochrome triheme protein
MKGGEKEMKKLIVFAIAVVVTFAMAIPAFAVPASKTVEFDGKGAGKVVFDGKIHAGKGTKCKVCHKDLFKMKKGTAVLTMKDMEAGKNCGACHNGTKAFGVKDKATCAKCHKK